MTFQSVALAAAGCSFKVHIVLDCLPRLKPAGHTEVGRCAGNHLDCWAKEMFLQGRSNIHKVPHWNTNFCILIKQQSHWVGMNCLQAALGLSKRWWWGWWAVAGSMTRCCTCEALWTGSTWELVLWSASLLNCSRLLEFGKYKSASQLLFIVISRYIIVLHVYISCLGEISTAHCGPFESSRWIVYQLQERWVWGYSVIMLRWRWWSSLIRLLRSVQAVVP